MEATGVFDIFGPDLPDRDDLEWGMFRKKTTTRACRIEGPFRVQTAEGPLTCEDGWLAVDSRGYLYPIAADEFERIYEPVNEAELLAEGTDPLSGFCLVEGLDYKLEEGVLNLFPSGFRKIGDSVIPYVVDRVSKAGGCSLRSVNDGSD